MKPVIHKKFTVLFIAYFFPPSSVAAAQRMFTFAKYLDPDLFDVCVLCPENIDSAYPSDPLDAEDIPDHIVIHKCWSPDLKWLRKQKQKTQLQSAKRLSRVQKLYEWLFFPDKGRLWALTAINKVKQLHRIYDFDLIFSSSPLISTHIVARHLAKKSRIPWVCEFRDYYATNNSQLKSHIQRSKRLEAEMIHSADHIITVCPTMKNKIAEAYPKVKNIDYILNGVDKDHLDQLDMEVADLDKSKKNMVYAGTLYSGLRNPLPIIDAINQLMKKDVAGIPDLNIVFIGSEESHLFAPYRHEPIGQKLMLKGALPRTMTLQYMRDADFFWLIVPDVDSHRDTIPAKVYEYLYFQKPILAYIPQKSEVDWLLNDEQNVCRIYTHESASQIEQKIQSFFVEHHQKLQSTIYDRKDQTKDLKQIFLKILDKRGSDSIK